VHLKRALGRDDSGCADDPATTRTQSNLAASRPAGRDASPPRNRLSGTSKRGVIRTLVASRTPHSVGGVRLGSARERFLTEALRAGTATPSEPPSRQVETLMRRNAPYRRDPRATRGRADGQAAGSHRFVASASPG